MRIQYRDRPRSIVYADRIARERRAQGLLLSPPRQRPHRERLIVEPVIAELRRRRSCSRDYGKALVHWLRECQVIPRCETSFDAAMDHLHFCSRERLWQIADALRLTP